MSKQTDYINMIAPHVINTVKKNGKGFPSAIIAHSITESGWGTSSLASKYNNYFGMKCGSSWTGKSVNMQTQEEYTVGTLTTIRDNFRAYDSIDEGIQGYFDFLKYSRYDRVWTAKTPEDFITMLKECGYCTSSTWVNTIHSLIRNYDLKRFDTMETPQTTTPEFFDGADIVTTANLNLRSGNNIEAPILLTIPKGSEVLFDIPEFVPVIYNGVKGYVSSNYLNLKGAKYVR